MPYSALRGDALISREHGDATMSSQPLLHLNSTATALRRRNTDLLALANGDVTSLSDPDGAAPRPDLGDGSRSPTEVYRELHETRPLAERHGTDAVFRLGTVFVEPRPRVKTKCPLLRGGGELHIVLSYDITSLPDPDGAIHRLFELADGSRSTAELYSELRASYPRLVEHDIADAVFQLVSVGLFVLDRWTV
jgi:hypothetical protein